MRKKFRPRESRKNKSNNQHNRILKYKLPYKQRDLNSQTIKASFLKKDLFTDSSMLVIVKGVRNLSICFSILVAR